MHQAIFDSFFQGTARRHLVRAIKDALTEDGPDLTSNAVFSETDALCARIVAKEHGHAAGLPLISMVLEETAALEPGDWTMSLEAEEGTRVAPGAVVARMQGGARLLLRAERVILNFICHLSGIANLTRSYVSALEGSGVRLLDTRKTLPGLRYPEKYAVLIGGGVNHRKNLSELLMLKDNHLDAAGGVAEAVVRLRETYGDRIPIEVECRNPDEVASAVECRVARIMLDNMSGEILLRALNLIPASIEVEISGGVSLENIAMLARPETARKPDFISVGRLTHSAPAADFSMQIGKNNHAP